MIPRLFGRFRQQTYVAAFESRKLQNLHQLVLVVLGVASSHHYLGIHQPERLLDLQSFCPEFPFSPLWSLIGFFLDFPGFFRLCVDTL